MKPMIVGVGLRAMLPLTMVKPELVTPAALMIAKSLASPKDTAWPLTVEVSSNIPQAITALLSAWFRDCVFRCRDEDVLRRFEAWVCPFG